MLLDHDSHRIAVECGDTSTTLVVDVRNGFMLTLSGEEWTDEEDFLDEVPVRWTAVPQFCGTLPPALLAPLQFSWARGNLDKVEMDLYCLAHSLGDDDYVGFADWIKDYQLCA